MTVFLKTLEDTKSFAQKIARLIEVDNSLVLNLNGDPGSGKTTFSRFLVKSLNGAEDVHSPTFTLMNIYDGAFPIYHFDFYRLESELDLVGINIEDYLPPPRGISIIEWGNKFREILPEKRLDLDFFYDKNTRRCEFSAPAEIMKVYNTW